MNSILNKTYKLNTIINVILLTIIVFNIVAL